MMRAWLAVLAAWGAACGKDLHETPDAMSVDARDITDAAIADNGEPAPGAVSLTIERQGVAVPGVSVVFQDGASAVVGTQLTDSRGRAWAPIPEGGYVTAIESAGAGLDGLTTFVGARPDDALRLELQPEDNAGEPQSPQLDVTLPADAAAPAGTVGYTIYSSCGTGGADAAGIGTVSFVDCDGIADIVAVGMSQDATTDRVLYAPNVTIPPSGALAIPGTWSTFEPHQLTYSNIPVQVQSLAGYQSVSATRRAYEVSKSVVPSSGSATLALALPAGAGPLLTATNLYAAGGEHGQQTIYDWGTTSASYSLDVAGAVLPPYATAPTFGVSTRTVTWTERATTSQPDVMIAGLQVFRDAIPTGHAWRWRLAGPRTGTTLTFPTLATAAFDYTPSSTDIVAVTELTALRVPGGFAAWRAEPFAPLTEAVTATPGHAVIQTLHADDL